MKTFIDPTTGQGWAFEDDVIVTVTQSTDENDNPIELRKFYAPHDLTTPLNVPADLVPGELPVPAGPTPADLKAAKLTEINDAAQADIAPYIKSYPPYEPLTWGIQKAEAEAYAADNNAATPWCDNAAASRGIDRVVFLGKVLAKAQAFQQISSEVSGYRQRLEKQLEDIDLNAADAAEQIAAIVYVSPLVAPEEPEADPSPEGDQEVPSD